MTELFEDVVECEGCGAEIVHLVCGQIDRNSDPDYRICLSCVEQREGALKADYPDEEGE